jgi:hypothetical protein
LVHLLEAHPFLQRLSFDLAMSARNVISITFPPNSGGASLEESLLDTLNSGGASSMDSPIILPCLQQLSLEGVQSLSDNSLLSFIKSRRNSFLTEDGTVANLMRISAAFDRDPQIDILHELKAERDAGMSIRLKYKQPAARQLRLFDSLWVKDEFGGRQKYDPADAEL